MNVKSTGPINILSVDVEGFDFDVLFGAGSVLDRTQCLEFECHKVRHWGKLHRKTRRHSNHQSRNRFGFLNRDQIGSDRSSIYARLLSAIFDL